MSYKPPFTITSKILSLVSDIVEIITDIKHLESNLNTPKLRKKNRVKSITATLQIEGNSFSEEKVTNVINGKTVLGTMREIAEVQGAIKDGVTHVAPPPLAVPELMGDLFEWLETTKEHPLIVSCVFHYEFEFIHPFSDGNGRIGRLWQSVILTHYKKIFAFVPIESVVRDNQEGYYKALEDSGSTGESTPFIEFMLEIILDTLNKAVKESKNVPLNRLDEILNLIEKNRDITSAQIAEILEVSDKTIKRDIAKLKELNRVQRVGSLKSGYWEIIK